METKAQEKPVEANGAFDAEWPALERNASSPKIEKKPKNNWKKYRQKKRAVSDEEEEESPKVVELDKSLMTNPEEEEKIMQLVTLFDRLDVGTIVCVLRGLNGKMEETIDQLLLLYDQMEKEEKKANEPKPVNSLEFSEDSDSHLSKQERLKRVVDLDDSDLEDFQVCGNPEEESSDESEWSQQESLQASYQSVESDQSSVYNFATGDDDSVKSSITEKYNIFGEDIELPTVVTQDSEVERWLDEFARSGSARLNSPAEFHDTSNMSLDVSQPLLASQTTLGSSFPLMGDSCPFASDEGVPELVCQDEVPQAVESEPETTPLLNDPKESEKPYFFALDDRSLPCKTDLSQKRMERHSQFLMRLKENKLYKQKNKLSRRIPFVKDAGTLTVSQSVVSVGVDPKEQTEAVTLGEHHNKIAEMEAEKRKAMSWCVEQMVQIKKDEQGKDLLIEAQRKQIEDQQRELERLNKKVQEMESQENKLQTLLVASKDMIVEGVQSLQKNISEFSSGDWVVLGKVKEVDIVEKMTQFASTLKDEISSAFSGLESSFQEVVAPAQEEEQVNDQEEEQMWMSEKASLESYLQELKKQIEELQKGANCDINQ